MREADVVCRTLLRKGSNQGSEPRQCYAKTAAERARAYRERLKADPEAYRVHRQYEDLRVKTYMAKLTPEKKAQYHEKSNIRVKKWRERKKGMGKMIEQRNTPQTEEQ